MIGKLSIEIGSHEDGTNDFLLGMATSAYANDGGFSPETQAINISTNQGVLYNPASATDGDSDAVLAGNILASCEDPVNGNNRLFVAYPYTSGSGTYYTFNGTKLALKVTDATTSYSSETLSGVTDMIHFNGKYYTTLATEITQWDGNTTMDKTWWTVTKSKTLQSGYRHPMLVYNKNLYIADKNQLWQVGFTTVGNGAEGTPVQVLTLEGYMDITALAVDPGSGKMLVGINSQQNASNTLAVTSWIGQYDGFNPTQFIKKYQVDDSVNGFYNVEGTVYVSYGNRLGYFTGSGISFLWKFNFSLNNTQLAYKHHLTNIGNTLMCVDKNQIFAMGKIDGKNTTKRYILNNQDDSNNFSIVTNVGSGVIGVGYYKTAAPYKFKLFNTDSVSTAGINAIFYSRRYFFKRPIFLRGVFVEYNTQITDGQHPGVCSILDDSLTTTNFGNITATGSQGVLYQSFRDLKVRNFQFRYIPDNTIVTGVRRFLITYDVAE